MLLGETQTAQFDDFSSLQRYHIYQLGFLVYILRKTLMMLQTIME